MNFHYGDSLTLIPGWFNLQFVENPGMAFGWMLPGNAGKLTLSIFRILVVSGIGYYLYKLIRQKAHQGFIVCVSLIVAGALGNIIDSAVYGLIFDKGTTLDKQYGDYAMYFGLAKMNGNGYAPFLMGNVVDMFHFCKQVTFPEWFPFWGGQTREVFPPVFNVADSSITLGIIGIMIWQKKFFKETGPKETLSTEKLSETE